jgi:hypothetical protein
MKHFRATLVLLLLAVAAFAQSPISAPPLTTSILSFPVYTLNAAPVPGASLSLVGGSGQTVLCYWAVANYQIGSVMSPLGCINNGPGTLSGSNYVSVNPWSYPSSVTSVDILRTSSGVAPVGACNCAVATALTSGGTNDQSNSLSSYTVALVNPSSFGITLANEVTGSGATHLIYRQNGVLVKDLSLSGSGTVTGSGTTGFLSEWTSSSALGNSPMQESGSVITSTKGLSISINGGADKSFLGNNSPTTCTSGTATPLFDSNVVGCVNIIGTLNPPAATTGYAEGLYGQAFYSANLSNTPALAGVVGFVSNSGTGNPNYLAGVAGIGYLAGLSGTAANVAGVVGTGVAAGSSTIATLLMGVDAAIENNSGTTQPSAAGLHVRSPIFTSIVSTVYGLRIEDQTVGGANNPNPYGIFEAGTAKNQLGGNTVFGAPFGAGPSLGVLDVAFSRPAPGLMALGNGTASDETALFRSGNACRITADVTLSTSATNICSYSLPAVAKAWAWQCEFIYAVTAGTTPTLSVGVNASQTPTGTTNGTVNIYTSNTDVGVQGSAPISTSGATNLGTTGTLTPAATIFQGNSYGTLLAPGTAGTFAITMTGTGASFAGVVKAGSTCLAY